MKTTSVRGIEARHARSGAVVTRTAILACLLVLSGCRVTTEEIQGWARKASGPRKLVAVLQHEKYTPSLRVSAALTLLTMKPRAGRNVGLQGSEDSKGLLVAFQEMAPPARATVIRGLAEPLARGALQKAPPGGDDPSIPYKDAAYALLTHDEGSLVSDVAAREHLKSALVLWCRQDFTGRFDNTAQLYGMEQVLRLLKDEGVAPLTTLLAPGFTRTRELSDLVRELGSDQTKLSASARLAEAGRAVDGSAWEATTRGLIRKRNQEASIQVDTLEFDKQFQVYRAVETERLFAGMKAVGGKPAVDYLLDYARSPSHPPELRILALVSLEGHMDRNDPAHAAGILRLIESDDSPDTLRDLALRRAGDLPYEQMAPGLYRMFSHRRWKVRWVAASLALRMADAKHLPEFMRELGKIETMTMGEALTYGGLLPSVRGVSAKDIALEFGQKESADGKNPAAVRLTALSYYYEAGTPADLPTLQDLTKDGTKVPDCPPADGPHADPDAASCSYICTIDVAGTPTQKEIGTVGQFVEYCLMPAIEARRAASLATTPPTPAPNAPKQAAAPAPAAPPSAAPPSQASPSPAMIEQPKTSP